MTSPHTKISAGSALRQRTLRKPLSRFDYGRFESIRNDIRTDISCRFLNHYSRTELRHNKEIQAKIERELDDIFLHAAALEKTLSDLDPTHQETLLQEHTQFQTIYAYASGYFAPSLAGKRELIQKLNRYLYERQQFASQAEMSA